MANKVYENRIFTQKVINKFIFFFIKMSVVKGKSVFELEVSII